MGENRFSLVPYRRFVLVNGGGVFLFDRADCQVEVNVTTAQHRLIVTRPAQMDLR